jgi:CRISPR-associated protein Csx14
MSRQIILISSLGDSPAVVTEAIDKLEQVESIQFNQVITLGTNQYEVRQGEDLLSEHIHVYYSGRITYIPQHVESSDILTEKENLDYLALVAETLRAYRRYSDVYVSLAGGRKTMSALMALAVQIYGAKLLCHVVHLMMSESLQRKMSAAYLNQFDEERDSLLHPDLEQIELARLPVVSLFPLINDFLNALGGKAGTEIDKTARQLLEANHLIEKQGGDWQATDMGKQLHSILNDIEMLPEPSSLAPQDKKVDIKDHHGKDELLPHAERLRYFPYAERIDSTDWNSQFSRSRALSTSHGRLLIEADSSQPDVLIVTLADSVRGYRLAVRTLAQSTAQAERVKREMEKFLRKES